MAPNLALPTKLIALEEHCTIAALGAGESIPLYSVVLGAFPSAGSKLFDLDAGRLRDMDAGNVAMSVLSCTAGVAVDNVAGCRAANDAMAAAARTHPDRFTAFAVLPMAFPNAAAAELERAVTELGCVGALIDARLPDGTHYDGADYWPVFATAERLDVPLYLHPAPPLADETTARYAGNYNAGIAAAMASGAWGWHADAGLSFVKLCAAGVFDAYPRLKIILGHNGEMVPAMLDRAWASIKAFGTAGDSAAPKRTMRQIWAQNVWVTVSGMFSLEAFTMLRQVTDTSRIMYATDYPYADLRTGYAFVQKLAESSLLTQDQLEDFAWRNAEKLLRVAPPVST